MNKHKKLFAILTLVCFLFTLMPMSAFAETEIIANGECGESAIWTLDSEGMLMISGTGVMYEYDFGEFPWSDRSSSIKEIIVEDGITTISGNAFYGCNNVEKVLLPESLETIGNDAFGFCEKLKEIVFPRNLKFIGDAAFYQCNSILELRIPRGLNALGDNPFYCMENLERITVESGNQNYYSDDAGTLISKDGVLIAFPANSDLEGYQVPDGVTVIGGRAFSKADNLQKIILPNGVAKICGEAFFQTDKLNELVFPETLRVIDIGAFDSCGLKEYNLPDGLEEIGDQAFRFCDSIQTLKIPASVTYIGYQPFAGCTNMPENIIFSEENEKFFIENEALCEKIENGVRLICCLTEKVSYEILDGVTIVERSAFLDCLDLEKVYIPYSVSKIGSNIFIDDDIVTDIYYNGTELEWGTINIHNKNKGLWNAEIHFLETPVIRNFNPVWVEDVDVYMDDINQSLAPVFLFTPCDSEDNVILTDTDNGIRKAVTSSSIPENYDYVAVETQPEGSNLRNQDLSLTYVKKGEFNAPDNGWTIKLNNGAKFEKEGYYFFTVTLDNGLSSGVGMTVVNKKDSSNNGSTSSSGGGSYYVPSTATQTSDDITVNNTNADVRVETSDVKVSVIANAKNITSKNSKIDIIGGEGCAVSVSAKDKQGNALEGFFTPVTVKIPIDSDVLKTVDNISQLTLAKVVTDETGNTSLVYMGGSYDTQTGVFAAYADESGDYLLVEDADVKKIELQIGNRTTAINGMDKTSDVAPRIIDNHTYVPLRYIAEILGCDVAWDDVERTVTIKHANVTMKLVIDEKIDGYDVAAVIRENRTLVPLRYIAEQLGANVIWHPETQEIAVVK